VVDRQAVDLTDKASTGSTGRLAAQRVLQQHSTNAPAVGA